MCKHSGYNFLHVAIPRIYKEMYLGSGQAWVCVTCPGGGYNFLHVAIPRIYKETYLGPGPAWARVTCPGGRSLQLAACGLVQTPNLAGAARPAACCRCSVHLLAASKEL